MYVACWVAKQMGVTPFVVAPYSTLAEWRKVAAMFGIQIEAVNYEKVRGVRHGDNIYAESEWGKEIPYGQGTRWVWHNNYDTMFFDEVHRCGGMTSLNSKLLIAAKRQAERVLTMSATAANDPRQMKALGFTLGLFRIKQFRWWLMEHGIEPGLWGGFEWTDDPTEQQEAMRRIGQAIYPVHGSRMRKAEIPGFPKTQIGVRLIDDRLGLAKKLAEDLAEAFKHKAKLEVITEIRQRLELLRVKALADMAEDATERSRVIIFVNFRATISALREQLKPQFGEVPVIDGDNTAREREKIKTAFQANEIPILLANNQAGGVGIGLHDPTGQVERTSIISPCYDPKVMEQVVGRPQRDGAAFSQQWFTYFADTLEEKVAATVQQGMQNIRALNDAILNGVII